MRVAPLSAEVSEPPERVARKARTPSLLRDYVSLTKPRLSSLVLFTEAGAMWLSGQHLSLSTWAFTLIGTAGTVGAANAYNCVMERKSDRFMPRTAKRPLPSGRIGAKSALIFATVLALISLPMLALGVNLLTAVLGLLALLSYVLAYTPLKSRTHWAMVVGAVPGALPPLMGWTAATGTASAPGWVLFGILFFWQLPHFIAIALFRKDDYRAAGLTSLPLERGDDVARFYAVAYLIALLPLSVMPVFLNVAGRWYLICAIVLGLAFAGMGVQGWLQRGDKRWARRFFAMSLLYLTGLFAALGLDGGL